MKLMAPIGIFKLSNKIIAENIKIFLCDASESRSYLRVLSSDSFEPMSFTVGDRISKNIYLSENEMDFSSWYEELIRDVLQRIAESEKIVFDDIDKIISIIGENLTIFLNFDLEGIKIYDLIWNQEFIDILRRIIGFSLYGNPAIELLTHRKFNDLSKKIIPEIINLIKEKDFDLSTLIKLAIISGFSGLDLKGAGVASSLLSQKGICMSPYLGMTLDDSIQNFYAELLIRLGCPTPVFHWNRFVQEITKIESVKVAWFTDDYIETFFDLLFIDKLLDNYKNISITVIPRNGSYGNDASWSDVIDILDLKAFKNLRDKAGNRFYICRNGPISGNVNLKKLSTDAVSIMGESNFIVIKGCRSHEMVQGGLNRPSFHMYAICREFSERVTGFDARESPLLFFYLPPGEYAFKGFNDPYLRTKTFPDGKKIYISTFTLEDRERGLKNGYFS
jgi:uncharacterized protein with ATP-grasp and redox domains